MKCNILKNLYIKSNGDVRCDDDYGERILLGSLKEHAEFFPDSFFNNPQYTKIRADFSNNTPPWREVCEKCAIFANGEIEDSFKHKLIKKIQIEPSLHCSLLCTTCSRVGQIREGRKPFLLSLTVLENFLAGIVREHYKVEIIEFCGQGEPLNHPQFSAICQLIKQYLPDTKLHLITNANFDPQDKLVDCYLDEIVVSCDGVDQASYEQFRVSGNFNKCIEFMKVAKQLYPSSKLIWKYIVFKHNDSDEQLIQAQQMADALPVNELQFIVTQYGPISQRFTQIEPEKFPIISRKATLKTHPYVTNMIATTVAHFIGRSKKIKLYQWLYGKTEPFAHHIDRISLSSHEEKFYLSVDGWWVPLKKWAKVFIQVGEQVKAVQSFVTRDDISEIYQYPLASGFRVTLMLENYDPQLNTQLKIGTHWLGQVYTNNYEFVFSEGTREKEPLVIPLHFWKKPKQPELISQNDFILTRFQLASGEF